MNRVLTFLFLSLALVSGCVSERGTKTGTVQIDLGKLLNARVVVTQANGQLQLADSLDYWDSSVLITKSAAEVSQAGKLNPLPDSGFFPANQDHTDVQLPYGVAGGGPQVHRTATRTETYGITILPGHYAQLQLYVISAAGPTPISVKLDYADGSSESRKTEVTDFYYLPKGTNAGWFLLAADFGKVNKQVKMTEQTHHYIHGYNVNPDIAKVLRQVEVTKEDSKSVLTLFGVTGRLK